MTAAPARFDLRPARPEDVPCLLELIHALAEFEHLTHLYQNTPERLTASLFGSQAVARALLAWTAADVSNKNQISFNGPKLILARNSHASSPFTVTLTSKVDGRNRTGDITTYSLEAGDVMAFKIDNAEGWQQADGFLYLEASNASVLFAIINL